MKKGLLTFSIIAATVLLTGTILASISIQEADAAKSSKPKEIVVVGSKVKEVVREAGLSSCSATEVRSESRVPWSGEGTANNGGAVVKIRDIPSDVQMVNLRCDFEDGSAIALEEVELKKKGTTIVIVSDPGTGIPSPG